MKPLHTLSLTLILFSACEGDDDDIVDTDASFPLDGGLDASAPDASLDAADAIDARGGDGGSITCYQLGTSVLGARIHAPDAGGEAFTACTTAADCTRTSDTFECSDRDVRLGGCGAAVATTRVDDYQRWFAAIEAELCPRIEAPCRASPSCLDTTVACVAGSCRHVTSDGGTL